MFISEKLVRCHPGFISTSALIALAICSITASGSVEMNPGSQPCLQETQLSARPFLASYRNSLEVLGKPSLFSRETCIWQHLLWPCCDQTCTEAAATQGYKPEPNTTQPASSFVSPPMKPLKFVFSGLVPWPRFLSGDSIFLADRVLAPKPKPHQAKLLRTSLVPCLQIPVALI